MSAQAIRALLSRADSLEAVAAAMAERGITEMTDHEGWRTTRHELEFLGGQFRILAQAMEDIPAYHITRDRARELVDQARSITFEEIT